MTTALFTHLACYGHRTPPGHPERVDRLRAVATALETAEFDALDRRQAPCATRDDITRVHAGDYVDLVAATEPDDPETIQPLDADTSMSMGSYEAALRAAGAVCAGVDGVMEGAFDNAFCAVRPPGHHAEQARAMGFCLFNSVGVGAMRARAVHGVERVAIVDFDVHHGNGGQDLAMREPEVFYASIHEQDIYPGTGLAHETGPNANVVNAPVATGMEGPAWRQVFEDIVLSALDAHQPQLILVSAGFDAHRDDPLAGLCLQAEDFAWATQRLLEVAGAHGEGRLVSSLEGGYDLAALGASAAAHVRALLDA